ALVDQEEDSRHEGQRRNHVEDQRMAHEGDVFTDAEKFHVVLLIYYLALAEAWAPGTHTVPMDSDCSFFLRPYHRFTTPRETKTAENMEVRIPRLCTTAKPRTGPEPNTSSAIPTI